MKFICTLCNYILEEAQGLPEAGIEAGTKFDSLPDSWHCPDCAAAKEYFQSCSCVSLPVYEATKVAQVPTGTQVAPGTKNAPAHTCK